MTSKPPRTKRLAPLLVLLLAGCGSTDRAPTDPTKKITWAEYQAMNAEQKDDPYVVDNLDDQAKKKRAESARKKK